MSRKLTNRKKMAVLDVIEKKKEILFGASCKVSKESKEEAWLEVKEVAVQMHLMDASKSYQHCRDCLWSVWKSRALSKMSVPEESVYKLDPLTKKILHILGKAIPKSFEPDPTESSSSSLNEEIEEPHIETEILEIKDELESDEAQSLETSSDENSCTVPPLSKSWIPQMSLLTAEPTLGTIPQSKTYFVLRPTPAVPQPSTATSMVSNPLKTKPSGKTLPTKSSKRSKLSETDDIDTIDELSRLRAEKTHLVIQLQKQLNYKTLLDFVSREIALGLPPSKITQNIRKKIDEAKQQKDTTKGT